MCTVCLKKETITIMNTVSFLKLFDMDKTTQTTQIRLSPHGTCKCETETGGSKPNLCLLTQQTPGVSSEPQAGPSPFRFLKGDG